MRRCGGARRGGARNERVFVRLFVSLGYEITVSFHRGTASRSHMRRFSGWMRRPGFLLCGGRSSTEDTNHDEELTTTAAAARARVCVIELIVCVRDFSKAVT